MKKGVALSSTTMELHLALLAFIVTGKKASVINRATPL
jgi:hypothetical protein